MKNSIVNFLARAGVRAQHPAVQATAAAVTISAGAAVAYFGGKAAVLTVCVVGGGIAAAVAANTTARDMIALGTEGILGIANAMSKVKEQVKDAQQRPDVVQSAAVGAS